MNKLLTSILATFSLVTISHAQLSVVSNTDAQQLGNILAGNNINVFNASITGAPLQKGTFNFTGNDLGLNSGVILSSGNIFDAIGPNNDSGTSTGFNTPGDPDLTNLAGFNTLDAVVFEFDFEVQGDAIEFSYVFMSEEYNEFVNSGFNDVFAFYISGPGIVGQENLAVVPTTTVPVTINTINNGSFWQFYNDNETGATNIEFDGFTTLMKAVKDGLTPCETYTLSLRIADGSDAIYDSAVLLQENSLVQTNVSATSSTFSSNNTALEGCIEANFTFQLDEPSDENVDILLGFGGSATNGVDYNFVDSIITIPAGQTSATVIIDAIADGITEGQEIIELYFKPTPCSPQDTVYLYIDDYLPLEYTVSPVDVSCYGLSDGQVDISVSGGLSPYTLTLTDSITGQEASYTSFPVTDLDVGTYYVDIIDGYGCTAEDVVSGSLFDAGVTFIPDGQGGSYQSTITLSGFGAGQTLQDPSQIQSICTTMEHSRIGELLITLTAPNGSQVILKEQPGGATTNMGEPCAVGPADGGQNSTGAGIGYNYCWQSNATYGTMVAEAGNFTYTYTNICDGSTQSDKYLPAGSYLPYEAFSNFIGTPLNGDWTIEVTDMIPNNNGYIFDWSISLQADIPDSIFTIYQPDPPVISHSSVQPDCGNNNGSIDLTVTTSNLPLSFNWSNGATTEDLTNIVAGTYTVDITDGSGCVHTYQVDLSNNGSLVATGAVTNETCIGLQNGAVDLTVVGGTNPITFSWSNGSTSEDVSGLAPGTHTVTVSDGAGCSTLESFTVTAAQAITSSAVITNEHCGDAEGIINLTVVGAAQPISFVWSNGDTTEDINELTQGTYSVNLSDGNGCTHSNTFSITNLVGNCIPDCDLAISASTATNEICGNGAGDINISVFTTNGPVQYNWSSGETTQDISSLSAGTYTVAIEDAAGCTIDESYTIINEAGNLSIQNGTVTNENCGQTNGAIDITVNGGAMPYSFSWSNGSTSEDLFNISANNYTIDVTDANGCTVYNSYNVANITSGITQTYGNAVDEVCGNGNGSIDIVISGGSLPYTYNWSNGATSQDLINISAGDYTCTITDGSGCSITTPTYTVNNQAGTLAFDNIDIDNEVCTNMLGDIQLFVSGGTMPYDYTWNTGGTTDQLSNLSAGTYSCSVNDANGCSIQTGNLIVINESGTLSLDNVSILNEVCSNQTGSVNITVSGGTQPVTYQWNTGSVNEDISNLSAGDYTCTITDANGCTTDAYATISNNQGSISIDNMIVTNESCGQSDGAINAVVSGGSAPIDYVWNNGATTEDLSNISAGSYTLTITDVNGCTVNQNTTVSNQTTGLSLDNVQLTNEQCGGTDGSINLVISGGVEPYTFNWSNGATSEDISNLTASVYSCTITDDNGCSVQTGDLTINNTGGAVSITLDSVDDEICNNGLGAVNVTVSGGVPPLNYSWSNGASSEDLTNLSAGDYTLTVTDAGGCSSSLTATVNNISGGLAITNIAITDETCSNGLGAIDITVTGGSTPYTFNWSNGATSEDISNLSAGTFTVTIDDAVGCSVSSNPIVVNNNAGTLIVDGINTGNEICFDGTGYVDLMISGNVGSLTYLWSNGATTQDINNVTAGTYTGTATDVNGCSVNFSAVVGNDPGTIAVQGAVSNVSCGLTNGSIDLTVTGANNPITYVWSNGATTEDITNLAVNSYTCNITDGSGCTANYTGTVGNDGSVSASVVGVVHETCGNSNGSIEVEATGGVGPYDYAWSNSGGSVGGSTSPLTNIPGDNYDVIVSDQNGCTTTITDILVDNTSTIFITNSLITDASCGVNNGAINLTVSSNSMEFYQWSNFQNTQDISGLSPGNYTVTITNSDCSISETYTVGDLGGAITTSGAITPETCNNMNGAIDLTVSGGTGNYTYQWNTGQTTEDISGLQTNNYFVTVTDDAGCSANDFYFVWNQGTFPVVTNSTVVDETCSGCNNGSIDITVNPANGNSYLWSNTEITEDISSLSGGQYYTVYITSVDGCESVDSFFVNTLASIDEVDYGQLVIYPNPAKEVINFDGSQFNGQLEQVSIYDTKGRLLFTEEFNNSSKLISIRPNAISTGTYILKIHTDKGVQIERIVIENR